MTSFIESSYSSRAEWEAAGGGAGGLDCPTLGYWKIRGLAAAPRMMFFYKGQKFTSKAYGDDYAAEWFGGDKPKLQAKNSMINLPYLVDGETVVTQSNSILVYVGKKLGIDKEELFLDNHQVIDQTMDLRNDLMKIVYPFAHVKEKAQFPGELAAHMQKTALNHFSKLDGFCKGPYMCGALPQSGDFHVFEMWDQHVLMCSEFNVPFDQTKFPKLVALHRTMKDEPALAKYFASEYYTKMAVNNPGFTHFTGAYYDGKFGPTITTLSTP